MSARVAAQEEYDGHARNRQTSVLLPLATLSVETALGVLDPEKDHTVLADPVAHLRQALASLREFTARDTTIEMRYETCAREIEDAHAVRSALEERLDKAERARVYAEDKAASADRARQAAERKVERLEQSIASRDEKERGKVARQAETIKSLEAKNAKLVEKVAAQWARAEEAKTLASGLRAEVQRLATVVSRGTTGDPAVRDEIVRLQGIVADHERWRRSISLLFFRHGRDETPWEWIRERVDSAGDVLVALRAYARSDIRFSRVLEALREHDRKGGE